MNSLFYRQDELADGRVQHESIDLSIDRNDPKNLFLMFDFIDFFGDFVYIMVALP